MKILYSIPDSRLGGPQIRSLEAAIKLRDFGFETVFLLPETADLVEERVSSECFDVIKIPFPRIRTPTKVRKNIEFLLSFSESVRRIQSVIAGHNIDLVHANVSFNYNSAYAASKSNTPLVWHFNGMITPWPLNRLSGLLAENWADGIVISSRQVQNYFSIPKDLTTCLYPPVNVSHFNPSRINVDRRIYREELNLDPKAPIVGTVANLNPVKGHDVLLDAIATVTKEYGEVVVPIVGAKLQSRKKYFQYIQDKCRKLGLNENISFVGWRDDIPELLALFDIFVSASRTETGPMTVLEAMSMNCPVVSTSVGVVEEQMIDGEHGWFVPPENSRELANGIISALNDTNERERRSHKAQLLVRDSFSIDKYVQKLSNVYENVQS